MKDVGQITDQEILRIVGADQDKAEKVKTIINDPSMVTDIGLLDETSFSQRYAGLNEDLISHDKDSTEWINENDENLIEGEVIVRKLNTIIQDLTLVFTWKISPTVYGSVEEITYWKNIRNQNIGLSIRYGSGEAILETVDDIRYLINLDNKNGIDINNLGYEFNTRLYDQQSSFWIRNAIDETDFKIIKKGFESNANQYMEENDWTVDRVELWFYGPLDIQKQEKYVDV